MLQVAELEAALAERGDRHSEVVAARTRLQHDLHSQELTATELRALITQLEADLDAAHQQLAASQQVPAACLEFQKFDTTAGNLNFYNLGRLTHSSNPCTFSMYLQHGHIDNT